MYRPQNRLSPRAIRRLRESVEHLERLGAFREGAIRAVAIEHGIPSKTLRVLLEDSRDSEDGEGGIRTHEAG